MEKTIYDYDGLCNLLAAVFKQARREARHDKEDAIDFLECVAPNRRKAATVDSVATVATLKKRDEVTNGS